MSEIIHSTYEIIKKIGSGGGGIVYLANHLNLDKKVVLKVDKRKTTTHPEILRREVDVMKNLSHTYIPQVYDFFIENDKVYTAIDFIDGESLDKPLKRGEKFSQPQVIKWAYQLLEALDYLHKPEHGNPPKGFVHSDIKPANLMRKLNNDICLIDFNIALALGEINLVGHSIGYASPEHYGIDYSSGGSEDNSKYQTVVDAESAKSDRKFVSDSTTVEDINLKEKTDTLIEEESEELIPHMLSTKKADISSDSTYVTESFSEEIQADESFISEETVLEKTVSDSKCISCNNNADIDIAKISKEETELTKNSVITSKTEKTQQQISSAINQMKPHENISGSSSVSSRRRIMPDVRSDIYMVGATLYHLLSGNRPAKDAKDVVPLSKEEFSPQIIDIISKAMNPNPDLRFQTSAEMLYAIDNLHKNDKRILQHKKKKKVTLSVLFFFFVLGILTAFISLKRIQTIQLWQNYVNYSSEYYQNGNSDKAIYYALKAIPAKNGIFTPNKIAGAQLALTNALGVYDLSDGYKSYKTFNLPSELLYMEISPNGKTALCMYAFKIAIINIEDCSVIDSLPVVESALSEAKYLDNDNIIYAGVNGITKYNISSHSVVWSGEPATAIEISADGKRVAGVYKDDSSAVIYDTQNGNNLYNIDFDGQKQRVTVNDIFANPNDNIFSLNQDGTILVSSFSNGSVKLFDLSDRNKLVSLLDSNKKFTHFEGGFYKNYFAFSASSKEGSVFAIIDTNTMEQTGGFESTSAFSVFADENGIRLQTDNILVKINPVSGEQTPLVTSKDTIWRFAGDTKHTVIATKSDFSFFNQQALKMSSYKSNTRPDFLQVSNGVAMVGSMDSSSVRILKFEDNHNINDFLYDSSCEHLEARISHDWQTVMLFEYRQFSIFDKNGNLITSVDIPDSEQVYDQQFIRKSDCSYLEVTYNDGKKLYYDSKNGSIIGESQDEIPDLTLYEEFETESYQIICPLHGIPEIYDIKTGNLLYKLQEDAYLTYATQIDEQLIVQYITADGYRYGQLLDSNFEVIAQLPYLCDVVDGKLVFDYPFRYIRICQIYDLAQLIKIAENQKGV